MTTTACTAPDCANAGPYRKGYCNMHYRRFRKYGDAAVTKTWRVVSPEIEQRMVKDYLAGIKTADIGDKYGVSRRHAYEIIRRAGVTIAKVGRPKEYTKADHELIHRMAADGKPASQIAARLGVSRNAICGILHRAKKAQSNVVAFPSGRKVPGGASFAARPRMPVKLSVVSNNVDLMVADWIKKNGSPRRFEPQASGDYFAMQQFLLDRGHNVSRPRGGSLRGSAYKVDGRQMTWMQLVAFVDKIRVKEGLQPIKVAS